jgi:hypothetical protein
MSGIRARREPARPGAGDLVGALRADGLRNVDAATPWFLDAPDKVWRVVQGRVDVFAVERESGQRIGLGAVAVGETLGRRHHDDVAGWMVLAVGIPGTVIEDVVAPRANDASQAWIPEAERLRRRVFSR